MLEWLAIAVLLGFCIEQQFAILRLRRQVAALARAAAPDLLAVHDDRTLRPLFDWMTHKKKQTRGTLPAELCFAAQTDS